MSTEKQLPQASQAEAGQSQSQNFTAETPSIRPAVDVYEDNAGITLTADLPGISNETLDMRVDRETLTIQGEAALAMDADIQPLYAEVRTTRYQRSFALSSELNTDGIEAQMKNGVLSVFIPKHEEHQPRRIAVNAA